MSQTYRIQSLKIGIDSEKFEPSDIFYALLDLHNLTEIVRDFAHEMTVPNEPAACEELNRLTSLLRVIADDVALIKAAAAQFDRGGSWVNVPTKGASNG